MNIVSDLAGYAALLIHNIRLRFTNKPASTYEPASFSGRRCQFAQMRLEFRLKATGVGRSIHISPDCMSASACIPFYLPLLNDRIKKDATLFENCVSYLWALRLSALRPPTGEPPSPNIQLLVGAYLSAFSFY